jgi:hypothetical protein
MLPFPPVRTAPAIFLSFSTFICVRGKRVKGATHTHTHTHRHRQYVTGEDTTMRIQKPSVGGLFALESTETPDRQGGLVVAGGIN